MQANSRDTLAIPSLSGRSKSKVAAAETPKARSRNHKSNPVLPPIKSALAQLNTNNLLQKPGETPSNVVKGLISTERLSAISSISSEQRTNSDLHETRINEQSRRIAQTRLNIGLAKFLSRSKKKDPPLQMP